VIGNSVLEEDDVEILLLVGCTTVVLFFDLHIEVRVCESFKNGYLVLQESSWDHGKNKVKVVYWSILFYSCACFKFK
jgi:hypothetical protein